MAEPPPLWIFAYGSLMWRPDFPFAERHRAALLGFHRALCIWSHLYRGTIERPGLVFGLDGGGSCTGVAFRVAPDASEATLEAVRCRELVTDVYREIRVSVDLADGRSVEAVTYVADPSHSQYAARLSLDETVRTVGGSHGTSGSNVDYVRNTHTHLQDLGVDDPLLNEVWAALETRTDGA